LREAERRNSHGGWVLELATAGLLDDHVLDIRLSKVCLWYLNGNAVENCGKLRRAISAMRTAAEARSQAFEGNVRAPAVMRACSACAGDYEDPDRTAWTPDDGDDGEEEQAPGATEEFPAE
jgi:hypothetical protein